MANTTMPQTQTLTKIPSLVLTPSQAKNFFSLSFTIAEIAEEWLEKNGQYSFEFLKGLQEAEKDIQKGRVKEIKSLLEL